GAFLLAVLPQRILLKNETARAAYAVPGGRIWTSAPRKRDLFHASSVQQPRQTIVSFNTARLAIKSVVLLALPGELLFHRPRPRPHGRIFDGDLVFECGGGAPRPAFDHVQIVARALKISLRTEIRHVDHERIAFPMAARVAVPLTYIGRQVWTC